MQYQKNYRTEATISITIIRTAPLIFQQVEEHREQIFGNTTSAVSSHPYPTSIYHEASHKRCVQFF